MKSGTSSVVGGLTIGAVVASYQKQVATGQVSLVVNPQMLASAVPYGTSAVPSGKQPAGLESTGAVSLADGPVPLVGLLYPVPLNHWQVSRQVVSIFSLVHLSKAAALSGILFGTQKSSSPWNSSPVDHMHLAWAQASLEVKVMHCGRFILQFSVVGG